MGPQPSRPSKAKKKLSKRKAPNWGLWLLLFAGACVGSALIYRIYHFISNRPTVPVAANEVPNDFDAPDNISQLNELQSQGATPENNLAIAIATIAGSGQSTPEAHAEFEERLGVKVPRQRTTGLILAQRRIYENELGEFRFAPWSASKHPRVVQYLDSVQSDLDQLAAQSERCTSLYWPRVRDRSEEGMKYSPVASTPASHVEVLSTSMQTLTVRSLMHYKAGNREQALRDALASFRLGTLLSLGRLSLEQVSSFSRTQALRALLPFINSNEVSLEQLNKIEAMVSQVPANAPTVIDLINSERIAMLDVAAAVQTQGLGVLTPESNTPLPNVPLSSLSASNIDYRVTLQGVNRWMDRVQSEVASGRPANVTESSLRAIDAEAKTILNSAKSRAKNPAEAGEQLANTVFVTQSYFSPILKSQATFETHRELFLLAIQLRKSALAGNAPPASLAEFLGEKRPKDRFTGEELVFRPGPIRGELLFYSRGSNGTDDGGQRRFANWINQDDLGIIFFWYGL